MRAISRDKEQKGEEKPLYSLVSGNNRDFFFPSCVTKRPGQTLHSLLPLTRTSVSNQRPVLALMQREGRQCQLPQVTFYSLSLLHIHLPFVRDSPPPHKAPRDSRSAFHSMLIQCHSNNTLLFLLTASPQRCYSVGDALAAT